LCSDLRDPSPRTIVAPFPHLAMRKGHTQLATNESGQRQRRCAPTVASNLTGCRWRMIRLGGIGGCTGHIGGSANPRPKISRLSRARHGGVDPGNNLLLALANDDVFAARTRLQLLDPALGGLQVLNDFKPSEIHEV
jgi:hypothetical protein